jgi:hypothetical protein
MDDDGFLDRDVNGRIGKRKPIPAEGMRKNTLGAYAGRCGLVQYRTQSTLPSPNTGLYMP